MTDVSLFAHLDHVMTGPARDCNGSCWSANCTCGFEHHERDGKDAVELAVAWHLYEHGVTTDKPDRPKEEW